MSIDSGHRTAIDALVADGVITADQAEAVLAALAAAEPVAPAAPAAPPAPARNGWLGEVAGYLGGSLMLGGLLLVIGTSWDNLSRWSQIAILGAVFVLLAGAATAMAGGRPRALAARPPSPQRRVVAVLYAISVAPVMPIVGLLLVHVPHRWLAAALVALAVSIVAWWLVPTVFGVLVMAVMSFVAAITVAGEYADHGGWAGIAVLLAAVVWAAVSVRGPVRPRFLGLGIAAAFGLLGAQLLFAFAVSWPAYTATAAVALGCLVLYRFAPEPVLVVAAVVGVTLAIPEALSDLTGGGLSAAYAVLTGGAVLVAGSVIALRLRRPARNVAR